MNRWKQKKNRIGFDMKEINRSLLVELIINLLIVPEFITLPSWPKKMIDMLLMSAQHVVPTGNKTLGLQQIDVMLLTNIVKLLSSEIIWFRCGRKKKRQSRRGMYYWFISSKHNSILFIFLLFSLHLSQSKTHLLSYSNKKHIMVTFKTQ